MDSSSDQLARATQRLQEMKRIATTLHNLCQPLTTLQCRLQLAQMVDTPEAYREAVDLGLEECLRTSAEVASMRELVRAVIGTDSESPCL